MSGLAVGGFIAIVIVILILNVAGVIGYQKFTAKNPDKAVSVKLDSGLVPKLRYGLLGLTLVSWIFSIACSSACTFVKITTTISSLYYTSTVAPVESFFGFGGVEVAGECNSYLLQDGRVLTAMAFAILNCLFTTVALIGVPLVLFNKIQDPTKAEKVWRIMGYLMFASTWCCLFTFYIQQAAGCDVINAPGSVGIECSLGGAGVAQAFNSIFLIGICALFFILPPPAPEDGADDNEKAEEGQAPEEATKSKESDQDEVEEE
ncbi:MAG: hypothetical protein SGBAC_007332 [Bacillariaceae sp.]